MGLVAIVADAQHVAAPCCCVHVHHCVVDPSLAWADVAAGW